MRIRPSLVVEICDQTHSFAVSTLWVVRISMMPCQSSFCPMEILKLVGFALMKANDIFVRSAHRRCDPFRAPGQQARPGGEGQGHLCVPHRQETRHVA